jgi:hypothetical protein
MAAAGVILLIVIIIIIILIALIYASKASYAIGETSGYDADPVLATAYKLLTYVSVIGFLLLIGLVVGLFFLFTEGEEIFYTGAGGPVLDLILLVIVGFLFTIGIIAAIATTDIKNSKLYAASNVNIINAYYYAVIAAAAGIGSFIFGVLAIIIYYSGESAAYAPATPAYRPPYNPYASRGYQLQYNPYSSPNPNGSQYTQGAGGRVIGTGFRPAQPQQPAPGRGFIPARGPATR